MFQVIIRGLSLLFAMWITICSMEFKSQPPNGSVKFLMHQLSLTQFFWKILSSSNWVKVLEALYQTNKGPVIGSFFGHKGSVWSLSQQNIDQRVGEDVLHRLHRWCLGKNTKVSWGMHTGNLPPFFLGGVLPVPDNAFNRITPSSGIWTGMSNPYPCFESHTLVLHSWRTYHNGPYIFEISCTLVGVPLKRMNNMNNEHFPVSMVIISVSHSNSSATLATATEKPMKHPPKKTKHQQQSWAVFFFFCCCCLESSIFAWLEFPPLLPQLQILTFQNAIRIVCTKRSWNPSRKSDEKFRIYTSEN